MDTRGVGRLARSATRSGAESEAAVVIVDLGVSFGGAVVSGSLMARQLARRGRSVTLVTALAAEEVARFAGDRVRVVCLRQAVSYLKLTDWYRRRKMDTAWAGRAIGYLGVLRQLLLNLPYAWRLARICRKAGASLLHANNGQDFPTTLASWLAGTALVVHLRGPYFHSRIAIPTERRASTFIAISDHVRGTAVKQGLPESKITTLHNPVEEDTADPEAVRQVRAELGGADGTYLVGNVGRILPWKGQLEFLRAVEPLLKEYPYLRIALVGDAADGGSEYEQTLHTWVLDRNLDGQVCFSGFRRDVTAVYAALDLLVHSAIEPEPFGRVIVEAMMQGTPVLAANAGGPTEIIADGRNGLLRDPRDPSALAEGVVWCLENPDAARVLGQAGKRSALERFSLVQYGDRVSGIYDEVLSGRDRNG